MEISERRTAIRIYKPKDGDTRYRGRSPKSVKKEVETRKKKKKNAEGALEGNNESQRSK